MQPGFSYLFPTGTFNHFRPLTLEVAAANVSTGVRYAETDASLEGLPRSFADSSICRTNSEFYYILSDSVASGTSASVYLDSALLANWNGIATRPISGNVIWRQQIPLETVLQNDSTFYKITVLQTGQRALIFNRKRPSIPVISGPDELCRYSSGNVYAANVSSPNQLLWNVSSGVPSSTSGNPIFVTWGQDSTGLVSVIQTDDSGCSSYPANFWVQLNPVPTASFVVQTPEIPYENESFEFASNGVGESGYRWVIEEEFVSVDSMFNKSFAAPGIYGVNLIVNNEFGCKDTVQQNVEVIEGVKFPNCFSPDGDGINDYLVFQNSGISSFSLAIFNRWGVKVFETVAPKVNWDGRTTAGELVAAGTYFYVLKASSQLKNYDKRGSVTILY
jgi:gliding motility-associated-like protein